MKNILIILFTLCFLSSKGQTFSFTLAGSAHTSAGVFRSSDSVLIRTLWSDVTYGAGTFTAGWDGLDNYGAIAPNNVSYFVRVLQNNVNYNWDGIFGNTSDVNVGTGVHRGYYTSMTGMCFSGTTAYFCQGYAEAYSSEAKFDISTPQHRLDLGTTFAGNKTTMVNDFVCTDGTKTYWAGYDGFNTAASSLVHASVNSTGAQYSFSTGTAYQINFGKPMTYTSVIQKISGAASHPTGIAVSSGYLYVAHGGLNELHVVNKTTGALLFILSYTNPRYIKYDGTFLWMVTGANTISKYSINGDGTLGSPTFTLSTVTQPGAIAVKSGTIAVIDEGLQVVRQFNTSTGSEGVQIGTNGGYATSPTVTNSKFMFYNYKTGDGYGFVEYAPDGSLWIGDIGNFRELHYSSSNTFIETIQSLASTMTYSVCVDPNNTARAFIGYLEFQIDYSQPLTGSTGWTFVRNWGYNSTANTSTRKLLYVTTLSNGKTYGLDYSGMGLVELTATGLRATGSAINNGILNVDGSLTRFTGRYDTGQSVTYTKYTLTGFTGNNPVWSNSGTFLASTPANTLKHPNNIPGNVSPTANNFVTESGKVIFFNPSLYYGGNTTLYWDGMHLGAMYQGTSTWLWETMKANQRTYNGNFPPVDVFEIGNGVNQKAGTNANVLGNNIITIYQGEFWKNGQTTIGSHFWENGLALRQFGTTAYNQTLNPNVYPTPVPFLGGNTLTPDAVWGATHDTIYLYYGDESYHGGAHRVTISNLNSISEQIVSFTSTGTRKTIPVAGDGGIYWFNGQGGVTLNPGDTGCITGGIYPYIQINGVVGTQSQPIIITNCGGQVICGSGGPYSFLFNKSRFVKFTGTGVSGIPYGFKAAWSGGWTGAGFNGRDSISNFEIDHYQARKVENGFIIKIDIDSTSGGVYTSGTYRGTWSIDNIYIHDCDIDSTVGEGLYGINTDAIGGSDTLRLPVPGDGWRVLNNIFKHCGWDAIQVASCRNLEIAYNICTDIGLENKSSQQAGIILGGRSFGTVHDNYLKNITGEGVQVFGSNRNSPPTLVYNNVIINAGTLYPGYSGPNPNIPQTAIDVDSRGDQGTYFTNQLVYVFNNTIVNPGKDGIVFPNSFPAYEGVGQRINNNLIVKPNKVSPRYIDLGAGVVADTTYNQRIATIAAANFVNYAGDNYAILSTSPAYNAGKDLSAYVNKDIIGTLRPQALLYDDGAYEYTNTGLIAPVITWSNPSTQTYPYAIGSGDLNATANVAGTHSYSVSLGSILNAGVNNITDVFTPTDQSTYSVVSKTVQITINKGTATITQNTSPKTYTGSPLGISVITTPSGLGTINTLYNGISAIPIVPGTYNVTSGLSNPNWQATVVTGTYTINPAAGIFTVSNNVYTYDSLLHTISVSTSDPRITYTVTGGNRRYSGIYSVTVHNTNTNFSVPDVVTTLTINKGTTSLVSWNPANLTYNSAIGAGQTNAIFAKNGVATYNPTTGFIPNAGILPIRLDFVPNDTNLLPINNIVKNITVNKGTDVMTIGADTTQYADGTVKNVTITTLHGGNVTINYTGARITPGDYPFTATYTNANWQATTVSGTLHILSNAANIFITNFANRIYTGSPIDVTVNSAYSYSLVYTPSNHTDVNNNIQVIATINDGIHTGADTVTMSIIKATPTTSWAAISSGVYPYIVGSGIRNASSPAAGTWVYSVNVGDTLSVGNNAISAVFTPTDAANYNSVTLTNSVTVSKGTAIINVGNLFQQFDSTTKYISVSTTPANLDSLIITYTGNHLNAGSYNVTVQLNNANYNATTVSTTLVISSASYQLSWTQPNTIPLGTALSVLQLTPISTIDGYFTFNYNIGQVLAAGIYTLVGTFHPTDSVNYPVQTITIQIEVIDSPLIMFFIGNYPVDYPY